MTSQTSEAEVAQRIVRIAHQERVAKISAALGCGEVIHPDQRKLREAFRLAVLHAIDATTAERGVPKMGDAELPDLFRAIDGIAGRVFMESVGL